MPASELGVFAYVWLTDEQRSSLFPSLAKEEREKKLGDMRQELAQGTVSEESERLLEAIKSMSWPYQGMVSVKDDDEDEGGVSILPDGSLKEDDDQEEGGVPISRDSSFGSQSTKLAPERSGSDSDQESSGGAPLTGNCE